MKKKALIIAVISLVFVLALTACGDDDTAESSESLAESAVESSVDASETEAITPSATPTPSPTATLAPTEMPEETSETTASNSGSDTQTTASTTQETQSSEAQPASTEATPAATEHVHTWVTMTGYTTETTTVHHDGGSHEVFQCCDCGAQFTDPGAANAHVKDADHSGLVSWFESDPGWDETVEVQVPYTYEVCSECGAVKGN